jgi:hypothetical protein
MGNQLLAELEQLSDRFPRAAEARDEANSDIIVFCETANLDAESFPDCAIRERVTVDFFGALDSEHRNLLADVVRRVDTDDRKPAQPRKSPSRVG